jgi:hypothetical protein
VSSRTSLILFEGRACCSRAGQLAANDCGVMAVARGAISSGGPVVILARRLANGV